MIINNLLLKETCIKLELSNSTCNDILYLYYKIDMDKSIKYNKDIIGCSTILYITKRNEEIKSIQDIVNVYLFVKNIHQNNIKIDNYNLDKSLYIEYKNKLTLDQFDLFKTQILKVEEIILKNICFNFTYYSSSLFIDLLNSIRINSYTHNSNIYQVGWNILSDIFFYEIETIYNLSDREIIEIVLLQISQISN